MTISDGDLAELAREVVDSVDPDLDIRIEPADPVDPYRFSSGGWTVSAGDRSSYIAASLSTEEARAKLANDLGAP
jgi:hypothetical protein